MSQGLNGPPLSKRVFDKYDRDRSQSISVREFGDLCYDLGHPFTPTEALAAVAKLDSTGTGQISYADFSNFWRTSERFAALRISEETQDRISAMMGLFKYFDADKSGELDRREFPALHAHLLLHGYTLPPVDECMRALDVSKDGLIGATEFVRFLIDRALV
jgi:Ca2+-binding EF-hand superfamily protein